MQCNVEMKPCDICGNLKREEECIIWEKHINNARGIEDYTEKYICKDCCTDKIKSVYWGPIDDTGS